MRTLNLFGKLKDQPLFRTNSNNSHSNQSGNSVLSKSEKIAGHNGDLLSSPSPQPQKKSSLLKQLIHGHTSSSSVSNNQVQPAGQVSAQAAATTTAQAGSGSGSHSQVKTNLKPNSKPASRDNLLGKTLKREPSDYKISNNYLTPQATQDNRRVSGGEPQSNESTVTSTRAASTSESVPSSSNIASNFEAAHDSSSNMAFNNSEQGRSEAEDDDLLDLNESTESRPEGEPLKRRKSKLLALKELLNIRNASEEKREVTKLYDVNSFFY
jgi:hypothetical protein